MTKPEYQLWAIAQVAATVGLSRATIYARIKKGTFPRPLSIGERCTRFRSDEIAAWLDAQTERTDERGANADLAKKAASVSKAKRAVSSSSATA
jgi:prophage regulatory protein